ncbi:MAG: glutathione S-transferase family protein [Thalassolituus sp.]|jgi:glutathione S-transferase|uniref:Glutathione S-transferase n=1 Tax=hydrothermal vent metagenome TaxID=652676 RepID=A0A160TEW3_9ZZZZ|nr:glutathione S-transferase family protein [Thalassolituus oleivorans]AHK16571.1 glutathione S-transferase [Thalassolituus oleivorans R6-15]APR68010.1 glutathione S-transferase [Thalassolituus oleivorans]MBQ0726007.1 glutathione S-transferase family protein [Thalassolituus oleivorans]MBQ0780667.1 glutathione S-transferase family protein [Thalassolituus oleivorans]MCA6126712.1 glutathione S-transferase [Thalassolituus oleivorans 4BN06-13]
MSIVLYQFPISHYCEKVRWALAYKSISYQKINLLPGGHIRTVKGIASESSVPVIREDDTIVQGSSQILDYLDERFPNRSLMPDEPSLAAEVRDWEERLDRIAAPAVRCFCYHHLLQQPSLVVPMLAARQPFYMQWGMRLGFKKVERVMRQWMQINAETALKAQHDMEDILAELWRTYSRSRFLVGDKFTRADLTACAIFAPLFQPSQYGISWPDVEQMPVAITAWVATQKDVLQSLALRYEQNR